MHQITFSEMFIIQLSQAIMFVGVKNKRQTPTRILFGRLLVATLEELDGGISSHAVLLGQFSLLSGVHLTKADL